MAVKRLAISSFHEQPDPCQIPLHEEISKKPLKLKKPRQRGAFGIMGTSCKGTMPASSRAACLYRLRIYWNGTALSSSDSTKSSWQKDKRHLISSQVIDQSRPACCQRWASAQQPAPIVQTSCIPLCVTGISPMLESRTASSTADAP
jgi:hypothetical protein